MSVTRWAGLPADDLRPPTRFDSLLHYWLAGRAAVVAPKTLQVDQDLLRLIPHSYLARNAVSMTPADIEGILCNLRARGLSPLSVRRHRASLSQFFRWCVRSGFVEVTPVEPDAVEPTPTPTVVRPFTAAELSQAWSEWSGYSPVLADVMLVLARTGLRWREARAITVADFTAGGLCVDKSHTEGGVLSHYSAAQLRWAPLVPRIRPLVEGLAAGRDGDELLLTTGLGAQLHRTAVLRRLNWAETGRGRRLHDLRHTAAYLWLDEGAEPAQVRAWMGNTRLAV